MPSDASIEFPREVSGTKSELHHMICWAQRWKTARIPSWVHTVAQPSAIHLDIWGVCGPQAAAAYNLDSLLIAQTKEQFKWNTTHLSYGLHFSVEDQSDHQFSQASCVGKNLIGTKVTICGLLANMQRERGRTLNNHGAFEAKVLFQHFVCKPSCIWIIWRRDSLGKSCVNWNAKKSVAISCVHDLSMMCPWIFLGPHWCRRDDLSLAQERKPGTWLQWLQGCF